MPGKKMARSDPRAPIGVPTHQNGPRLASVLPEGRTGANTHIRSGAIWVIPVQSASEVAPKNFCVTISDVLWNHLFVRGLEVVLVLWTFIGDLQRCEPAI